LKESPCAKNGNFGRVREQDLAIVSIPACVGGAFYKVSSRPGCPRVFVQFIEGPIGNLVNIVPADILHEGIGVIVRPVLAGP
jgi:hypothetical protein